MNPTNAYLLFISSKLSGNKSNIIKPRIIVNEKPTEKITRRFSFLTNLVIKYPNKNDNPDNKVIKIAFILCTSISRKVYHNIYINAIIYI